jgi:hypothetical protein
MRRLWRGIIRNFWWKLASLSIAIMLWIAGGEAELIRVQAVPLLYRNLHTGMLLLADTPDEIHIELRGRSGALGRAALSEVVASIDLSGVSGPGERTFTLAESDFSLPSGVDFLRAVPSQVRLRFDRIMSKDVPVTAHISGNPPAGHRVVGALVTPNRLTVSGPEQMVQAIAHAETDPVDVRALSASTDLQVNAIVPDARVQFKSAPVVTVHVTIEKMGQNP